MATFEFRTKKLAIRFAKANGIPQTCIDRGRNGNGWLIHVPSEGAANIVLPEPPDGTIIVTASEAAVTIRLE